MNDDTFQHSFQNANRTYYDPLYEVVLVTDPSSSTGERGSFWGRNRVRKHASITHDRFLSIVDSYEFSRMNFLHQAGFVWLIFPSATHTRFAHALGCWHLSDLASDNVIVNRKIDENKGASSDLLRLSELLTHAGIKEEFHLALLLHDIGHFPFSHVIENNLLLGQRYPDQDQTKGIILNHETIGTSLIQGENKVSELFSEYIRRKIGDDFDKSKILSNCLKEAGETIDQKLISHLISPKQNGYVSKTYKNDLRFINGLHDLVSGVIDLDRIDHYRRDSFFTSIRTGEFNVIGLILNMAMLDGEDPNRYQTQLMDDGIEHAFQILYAKSSLTRTVFHHEHNLAYEIMLNRAINLHWDVADDHFRTFLPFYDDMELLQTLLHSSNAEASRLIQRIQLRIPFRGIGKFCVDEATFESLEGETAFERRNDFYERFRKQLKTQGKTEEDVALRLDKQFGKSVQSLEWMDLAKILDKNESPLDKMQGHLKFIDFIRDLGDIATRTFWIYSTEDDAGNAKELEVLATQIGGKKIS